MTSQNPESSHPPVSEPTSGLAFQRRFTRTGRHPFEAVAFVRRDARILEADGAVVFEMRDVEVPEAWSQLATDIVASKYFRKTGVPVSISETGAETSVKQLLHRVAHTIRMAGVDQKLFATDADADSFEMELLHLLVTQKGAFNSPVWFNCGLWAEYGITGSAGNWWWNPATAQAEQAENGYEHPQCAACFIQSVDDDLMGLFELMKNEARLFKFGSGTGTNFSNIRGRQEQLSGGGLSSGLMSFLEVLDRGAGATKSGGTTRRAAKMVSLDMDHPEIVDFIQWKTNEERKARILIQAGYSADFNGEAYHTVSGQNSNNSVRLSDAFMQAAAQNAPWETTFRTTGEVCDTFDAAELLQQVAEAAWQCADPGVQYDDTINRWNTCADTARIRGSNPCSEFHFLDDTACNLASLNLVRFVDDSGAFDSDGFLHACRVFFTAQEILVDFSSYPTQRIAENSHRYRPLGLGYANLGSLLMQWGLAYDSAEGCAITAAITALLHGAAYRTSAEIAAITGAFDGYADNQQSMQRVMRQHWDAVSAIGTDCPANLRKAALTLWDETITAGERHGYRNAQATVLAPTGTIGLLMDCDTTGIEPEFSLVKWKKLAGGGHFKIVNQSVPKALQALGYSSDETTRIVNFINATGSIEGAPFLKAAHFAVFDCASAARPGGRFLAPSAHLNMMIAAQPFLSGAISKTVNIPHEATVADILVIYVEGWQRGLKCVALYRDGSKGSQPLNTSNDETQQKPSPSRLPVPLTPPEVSTSSDNPPCVLCGFPTILTGGCYQCENCGHALSCS